MKKIILGLALFIFIGCSESSQQKVDAAVSKTGDSLKSKLNKLNDTLREGAKNAVDRIPKVKVEVARTIPISLQWIGFEGKQGTAKIAKAADGWYSLKGEQTNANNEFLKIDGKIQRLDKFNMKFVGTIITYVKSINGAKPCEKTGEYVFLKKGARPNYRLQQMQNCGGGNVVDYVDLYKLDDIL